MKIEKCIESRQNPSAEDFDFLKSGNDIREKLKGLEEKFDELSRDLRRMHPKKEENSKTYKECVRNEINSIFEEMEKVGLKLEKYKEMLEGN